MVHTICIFKLVWHVRFYCVLLNLMRSPCRPPLMLRSLPFIYSIGSLKLWIDFFVRLLRSPCRPPLLQCSAHVFYSCASQGLSSSSCASALSILLHVDEKKQVWLTHKTSLSDTGTCLLTWPMLSDSRISRWLRIHFAACSPQIG